MTTNTNSDSGAINAGPFIDSAKLHDLMEQMRAWSARFKEGVARVVSANPEFFDRLAATYEIQALPPVLTLATYRKCGRRQWRIREGLSLWCTAYPDGRIGWWVSLEEPMEVGIPGTEFGCTLEVDSVEVPDILLAIQRRSQV